MRTDHNPFTLEGKTVLVTGASSGIGRSIAVECSRMGAAVVITARNEERLAETLSMMDGEGHSMFIADLATDEGISALAEFAPQLEGLVLNAGKTEILPFQFVKRESLGSIMDINFFSPTLLAAELLRKKKIAKGASVVFISSIMSKYCTSPGNSQYTATKGAIDGIMKGMALDLAPKKIRVNSVNPGMINTNILASGIITEEQLKEDAKRFPLKRYGEPEEVAYGVIYLLSDASSWTTGSVVTMDGGFTLQ